MPTDGMTTRARVEPERTKKGPEVKPSGGMAAPTTALAPRSQADILFLQSAAGNAAVNTLLEVQRQPPAARPRSTTTGSQPLVKRGSRGPVVEELQTKLNLVPSAAPDLFLPVDGKFDAPTETAVNAFQKNVMGMAIPDGKVGKNTWPAIDKAVSAAESAPHPHPVLNLNDSSPAVGEAQEKLNATAGTALLSVDAVFGAPMLAAVKDFQHTKMAIPAPSGVVDVPTWTALDNAAPGGGTRTARGGKGIEEHVGPAGGGDPLATAIGSIHPVVGPGNVLKGIAVREAQQKLNGFLAAKGAAFMKANGVARLSEDGAFGPKTQAVLVLFQSQSGPLPPTGLADAATWTKLDAFSSTVGTESRKWQETVGGHTYGLTSVYSWALTAKAITITVGFNFVPPTPAAPMPAAPLASWLSFIKTTWNQFKAVDKADPKKSVDIVFNPIQSTDPSARTVKVMPGSGRSDAGQFFVVDPDIAGTVSHEFGHMIGLKDEYQQTAADIRASTGYEAPVGQTTGPAGVSPAQLAQQLQNAIVARAAPSVTPSPAVQAVAGMGQGAFAQRVISAYKTLPSVPVPAVPGVAAAPPSLGVQASAAFATTGDLVKDLDKGLTNFDLGSIPSDKYKVIEVLSYDSGSVMGDPSRQVDQHEHGAEPRHLREFSQIVAHARGGAWLPQQR
ncbi:MAG TPA: peptidoglycan-binding protein [Candidatus Dormibacteraeota bacterium]